MQKIARKRYLIAKPNLLLTMPRTMLTDQHWLNRTEIVGGHFS